MLFSNNLKILAIKRSKAILARGVKFGAKLKISNEQVIEAMEMQKIW